MHSQASNSRSPRKRVSRCQSTSYKICAVTLSGLAIGIPEATPTPPERHELPLSMYPPPRNPPHLQQLRRTWDAFRVNDSPARDRRGDAAVIGQRHTPSAL